MVSTKISRAVQKHPQMTNLTTEIGRDSFSSTIISSTVTPALLGCSLALFGGTLVVLEDAVVALGDPITVLGDPLEGPPALLGRTC